MPRNPIVSGKFYSDRFNELEHDIKDCFLHKKGPGDLPISKRKGFVQGIIAPHAGYTYSGPCSAWVYKEIAEAEKPDVFIIIGPNHSGLGDSTIAVQDWITPLGTAKCDSEFAKFIEKKTDLVLDRKAMPEEHSIEVQLPFLQFVMKNDFHFVPISLSNGIDLKKFILDMKEVIVSTDKKITFIVSSDFTHYGHMYHYVPFESDRTKRLYDLDGKAISLIKNKDLKGFFKYIKETGATICGALGIGAIMGILNESEVKLLSYYTSGDISGDDKNSVGYAGILFK